MIDKATSMMAAAIVSCGMSLAATPTEASAVEFFKCTLAPDATMDQLVTVAKAMLKDAKANGFADYTLHFHNPLYSEDISNGTFYWVGDSPNALRLGAYNDYWNADANKTHRDRFRELIKDCDSAGLHWSVAVKADE